jgi:hypothetical protein
MDRLAFNLSEILAAGLWNEVNTGTLQNEVKTVEMKTRQRLGNCGRDGDLDATVLLRFGNLRLGFEGFGGMAG